MTLKASNIREREHAPSALFSQDWMNDSSHFDTDLCRFFFFFNLLSLVNIQSLAVGFGGLLMEALAKSAEKPYAEIAHSQKKHGNIMLRQWDENL